MQVGWEECKYDAHKRPAIGSEALHQVGALLPIAQQLCWNQFVQGPQSIRAPWVQFSQGQITGHIACLVYEAIACISSCRRLS